MSIRVSADGTADYSAISDAVQAAADNEVINVAPGTYSESIFIKKPLTLAGDGPRDQIIIHSKSPTCINIEAGKCVIKGLTLGNEKHQSENDGDFTISVDDAEVVIDDCDITGSSLASVGVYGSSANVTIKNCVIHRNVDQSGIYFHDQSTGRVEDCKIHNNSKNGINIKNSHVIIQNSTIENNNINGIYISENAEVTVTNCKIHNNSKNGISIKKSHGIIQNSTIGKNNSGIYIYENAEVTVTNCKVVKNNWEAVTLKENSKCNISESDLTYNGGEGAFDIDDSSSLTENSNKLELTEKEILARIKDPEAIIWRDIERYLKHDSEKIKLQAKLTLVGRDDCYYRLLLDFAVDENPKVRLGTAKHSMSDLVILNQLKNDKDPAVKKYVSSVLPQRKKAENLAGAIVKWLKKCQENQLEGFNDEEDICEAYITIYDAAKKDTPGKYCEEFSFGNSVEFDDLVLDLQQFLYKNLKSSKKYHLVVQYRYLYDKKDIEFGEFIVDFKKVKVTVLGSWNISDPKCNPVLINKVLQAPVPEGPRSEKSGIDSSEILIKALQNPTVSGKSITEFWNQSYERSNHWENFSEEDKETQKKMIHAVTNNPALKSFMDQLVFIQDAAIREIFMKENILVNQYPDEWNDWSQKRFDLVKNIETPQTLYADLFRDKGVINKVLEEFGQLDELLQQKIISCIRELDFKTEGHWRVFKSFYKASEKIRVKEILSQLLIRLELMERSWGNWKNGFISKNEYLPGWRTVLYMKRRGRRFMKKLADENPDLYVGLAFALMTRIQDINPWSWITHDTLLGRSTRFLHTRHGKGKVKQIIQDGFPHRFEERSKNKDLWNGKAEEIKELLEQKEDHPWQVEEFAVKILHRTHSDYPFQHSDSKTIQPDRIKGWFGNPSVWLKYLAGKGAERLFKEPVTIAEKRAGDSLLIECGWSDIFANMLFYAADDIRTALHGSAVKSYPIPAFDHHLFDLDNNPVISSLVQHFNSISSLDLAEPQAIHAKTGILLQVCKEMVNDAKNDSLANSLWFVKDVRHYNEIRGGAEKKAEEVQYLIYNEDGTIVLAEKNESEAEIAAPGKKVMDYLNTARDPKCTSKKLINITDDVSIPWDKPEAEDLLVAICSNSNTPADRLAGAVDNYGKSPKVCIGIAANPECPTGLKGKWDAVRIAKGTTVAAAQRYILMKFYYEYLCTTLSLLKTTLPAPALTQRSLQTVKLINADIFSGYFVKYDIRDLVLDIAEILFRHKNDDLNKLCYTALKNYPAIQYDEDVLKVVQRWLEAAKNGTGEQKKTVSDQMSRIIANVELSSYRKYDNVHPFINHESLYISDFIWSSISMYSETFVPHELWLYVLKQPARFIDWSDKSMEEINAVTKLSNALQSKSAVQLLTGILEEELKILKNSEPDKDSFHIYPELDPKLMIYLVNKKITGISGLIFEMIEQKVLSDDPAEWLPLINELTGRQKTKLKSVMINCLKISGNISLEWLSHIVLFNKTEQKRIKNIIIKNLNGKKSITLDWFIHEEYLALFNDDQQTHIENIIVNSYCDFTFKEEYYKSNTHPLRHYMIYPLGFKGDDDMDAFGPRMFDVAWKIAEVGILKDNYLGAFIDDLLAVPQNRARTIVKRIHSLHNEGFQDSVLAQLEKRLLQDKSKIVVCSSSVSKLMIDNLPYEKTLDYLTVDDPAIWTKLKPHMLRKISHPGGGMFFWQHVFNYLSGHERSMELHKVKNSSGRMILEGGEAWKREVADGNIVPGSIYTRTLKDPEFLDKFYSQKDPETLSIHNPLFADEIISWVQKHEKMFKANSDYLLTVSTHKLPVVRQWGLKKSKTLGMRLPFALQLIESSLPEPYKIAQDWFRAGTGRNEFINILALCDSPLTKVQHFGLKLMNKRKSTLLNAQKMEMIAENSDPKILEFVAGHLLEGEEHQQFMRLFDRTILKHKEKYRKVKETIKQRVEKDLSIDPETLIEMVRGHQKRDAEWALVQLTKMSLKGQAIDGFEVQQMK